MTLVVEGLLGSLRDGSVDLVDLTQPLSERTPVIRLPPEVKQVPPLRMHRGSQYGSEPHAWNWLELGEHVGTHIDAPIHWVTGREYEDVASIPALRLIAPAVVIDRTREVAEDPDYLLTIEDLQDFEAEHGALPEGGWLLMRTGWSEFENDPERFLAPGPDGPRTPGFDPECARWIAESTPIAGIGTETVGIDAGQAFRFDPPFPIHHFMFGAGKYTLSQLANLDRLPAVGSLLIVAPLRLVGGTGSPARVFALAPSPEASQQVA
jgi:kynurenine formamidase